MRAKSRRDGASKWYRAGYFVNNHIDDFVVSALGDIDLGGAVVVDLGCGAQPYRPLLERRGAIYIGVDHSISSQQKVDIIADAMDLPLESDSVDVILCTELLEHIPSIDDGIAEIGRVIRQGTGCAVITTPFMFGLHEQPFDFLRPTPHLLKRLLESNGMTVIDIQRLGGEAEVISTIWEFYWNRRVSSRSLLSKACLFWLRMLGIVLGSALKILMRSTPPHAYLNTGVVARSRPNQPT